MSLLIYYSIIGVVAVGIINGDGDGKWGYRKGDFSDPAAWKDLYKSCGGKRQTPININKGDTEYWNALREVTSTKSSSSSKVSLKKSDLGIYLLFNDGWNISFKGDGCFRPVSIHWHWGSTNYQGSEHTMDGTKYPIEGHLVTYNCNLYDNAELAMASPSGLHVFGMLYKVGPSNPAIGLVTSNIMTVKSSGSATMTEIPPLDFLPANRAKYYRYEGSLTTPPCTENVIWTLFSEIQTIGQDQLILFRSLAYGKPENGAMVDNFRPVIPISDSSEYVRRVVYSSFKNFYKRTCPSVVATILALLAITSIY